MKLVMFVFLELIRTHPSLRKNESIINKNSRLPQIGSLVTLTGSIPIMKKYEV